MTSEIILKGNFEIVEQNYLIHGTNLKDDFFHGLWSGYEFSTIYKCYSEHISDKQSYICTYIFNFKADVS